MQQLVEAIEIIMAYQVGIVKTPTPTQPNLNNIGLGPIFSYHDFFLLKIFLPKFSIIDINDALKKKKEYDKGNI